MNLYSKDVTITAFTKARILICLQWNLKVLSPKKHLSETAQTSINNFTSDKMIGENNLEFIQYVNDN